MLENLPIMLHCIAQNLFIMLKLNIHQYAQYFIPQFPCFTIKVATCI